MLKLPILPQHLILYELDHIVKGLGDCQIVNKCTAQKNNMKAGYKLYAGTLQI